VSRQRFRLRPQTLYLWDIAVRGTIVKGIIATRIGNFWRGEINDASATDRDHHSGNLPLKLCFAAEFRKGNIVVTVGPKEAARRSTITLDQE
jgi:hypothetical protein